MSLKKEKFSSKVISVASGKGGVGKTVLTVNLALAARRMGYSVLILDGDLGLANVDVLLGLTAKYNLFDVLQGHVPLKSIILEGPLGVKIIPSGSGISKLSSLSLVERIEMLEHLEKLDEQFDVIFIDTGAGISDTVTHLNSIADQIVVVTNSEPHAMTDAYAFIKVMKENFGRKSFDLVVNMTRYPEEGLKVFGKISEVARRFIGINIDMLGSVPLDAQIQKSIMVRRAASENSTYTLAGQCWNEIARNLFYKMNSKTQKVDRQFWQEFLKTKASGHLPSYAVS
jgi:flagellar biosynthesis protein FlhG